MAHFEATARLRLDRRWINFKALINNRAELNIIVIRRIKEDVVNKIMLSAETIKRINKLVRLLGQINLLVKVINK